MPDKWKNDGNHCLRCWQNKMKHGCPQAKKWLKTHSAAVIRAYPYTTHYREAEVDGQRQ